MERPITITKLEAARRQLETAIRLYFTGGDLVSVHTLAGAAYGLVQGLNVKRGGTLMLKDLAKKVVTKKDKKCINCVENFLKHADKDPDAKCTLDSRWTEALLFEASLKYCELSGENPPLLQVAYVWFIVSHPGVLDRARQAGVQLPPRLDSVFPKDRRRFFEEYLPVATAAAR